jgi:hypothetical protein
MACEAHEVLSQARVTLGEAEEQVTALENVLYHARIMVKEARDYEMSMEQGV